MKICIISGSLPPKICGVGDYVSILSENLSQIKNTEVVVITSSGYNLSPPNYGVRDIVEKWTFSQTAKLFKEIRSINPDIVHIQYPTTEYGRNLFINIFPLLLRMLRKKIVITLHEYSHISLKYKIRNIPNILSASRVIVTDPVFIDTIANMGFPEKKMVFFPIFANIPKTLLNESEKSSLRDSLVNKEVFLLGFFGFVMEKKGFDWVLDVLKTIKEKNISVKLLFIGQFNDNDLYHKKMKEKIHDLNLSSDVIVSGFMERSKVADYISIVDCMILPFKEGLSPRNATFLASLNQSVPIVTSQPGMNLWVDFKRVRFFKEPAEILDLVLNVLFKERDAKELQKEGADLVFSPYEIARQHFKLYQEVLG